MGCRSLVLHHSTPHRNASSPGVRGVRSPARGSEYGIGKSERGMSPRQVASFGHDVSFARVSRGSRRPRNTMTGIPRTTTNGRRGRFTFADSDRPRWHAEVHRVAELVRGLPPRRTVHIACGTGFLTGHLRGFTVGLDQSRRWPEWPSRDLREGWWSSAMRWTCPCHRDAPPAGDGPLLRPPAFERAGHASCWSCASSPSPHAYISSAPSMA